MSINTSIDTGILKTNLKKFAKELLLKAHPINSYFITESNDNPSDLFGGTWIKVEGKFLLGSSSSHAVGSTGGEETHTLSINEMPKHYHRSLKYVTPDGGSFDCNAGGATLSGSNWHIDWVGGGGRDPYVTGYAGESKSHNNMPPFKTVNIWKRIS